jgi:imidazolonepropionase-like amidohydrolase
VETGALTRHVSITIAHGRICGIVVDGQHRRARKTQAAQIIDGRDRYALPGFTVSAPWVNEATLIGYGITTVSNRAPVRTTDRDDVHDALARMVAGGNSPLQALQAAINPDVVSASYTHSNALTVGGEASLLLLEQNPLEDIANTRSISLVLLRGEPYGLRLLARARAGRQIDLQPFSR